MKCLVLGLVLMSLVISATICEAAKLEGLVLYLPFDEGEGKETKDLSGNGNDGTLKKGPKWVDGKFNKALEFNSNYVEVPDASSLDLEKEVTIAVWIKPALNSPNGWGTVVTKGADAAENYELLVNNAGHLHTGWQFAGGRQSPNRGPAGSLKANEWQHIAVTYKPGAWITYIDGKILDEIKDVKDKLVTDNLPLCIGDDPTWASPFIGIADEVVIFSRAITTEEMKEVMGGMKALMAVFPKGKLTTTWGNIKFKQLIFLKE